MKVYQAINAITADLSKIGIAKDSTNSQQGYKFRGIDAVYSALSPLLAKHGLCILPRVMKHNVTERVSSKGTPLFYTVLHVEFDFVSAEDGSKHTVSTIGEGMDSADKSSSKCMSAAYKYAAFQAFAIPTEGDNDADNTTHVVEAKYGWINTATENALAANEKGDEDTAWEEMEPIAMGTDNEAQLYAWALLGSKGAKGSTPGSRLRSLLKERSAQQRERDRQIAAMSKVVHQEPVTA